MFLRNKVGVDLIPGILAAVAVAGVGLAFVGRFFSGVEGMGEHTGNTLDLMTADYLGASDQAIGIVR